MRKLFLFVMAAMWAASMWAVPVRPGLYRMEKQPDGTEVKVFIHGDEWFNYETDSLDNVFERDTKGHLKRDARGFLINTHKKMTDEYAQQQWQTARRKMQEQNGPRKAPGSPREIPRVLVILVEFPDKPFQEANRSKAAWNDFLNKEGYHYKYGDKDEDYDRGSVRDYFIAQSGGKYKPQFDVVGPVTAPHGWKYYDYYTHGSHDHAGELVPYLCEQVDKEVDFTQYDADKDGKIDLVAYIYAGPSYVYACEGIWPHQGWASGEFDSKKLDEYCCASEILNTLTKKRVGIGTFCHEFSHALGFPDYYVGFCNRFYLCTPNYWSLMDQGCNLVSGHWPPNYSIYDKYYMGWETPKVLKLGETVSLKPSQSGYVVTRDGKMPAYNETDTVYYLENRQNIDWDERTRGHGLLIWQVTYDQKDWSNNACNKNQLRMTLIPSSGDYKRVGLFLGWDTYPGNAAKTIQKLFNYTIYNISEDSEGNVTFSTDLFASASSLSAKLKKNKNNGYKPEPIENASRTDTVLLKVGISGNVAGDFELQYLRHYGDGSKDADYITRKCWSVTKAEAIKGYEWLTEEPLALYKNCSSVDYRVKGSSTIDGKKKEFYSNIIPVQLSQYSVWFYPGSVRTRHSVGETNIKIAEHTNDCAIYDVQCEQEAKVSVIDGWVVLDKMPCADVKIYTQTDKIKHYVYFLDYDGSILKSQLVKCGGNATPPADPSYKGMEFIKWNGNYTNVHGTSYVYAQYEGGGSTEDFVNIEMTEHTCIDLQPFTGTDFRDKVFAGNDKIALTGDHLTFRFTQESDYGGTVYFWWTQTFDSETGVPDFHSSVKTKVGTLTAEQAKARQDMFYTYDICNTSACVDEKTFVEKMAFKFVYNSNGTNYESKPMVFEIYYPLVFRFKRDDDIKGLLQVNGVNSFTNDLNVVGQMTKQGEYEYAWIPARSQENVFYRFTNMSFQDINSCITMSRLRYPKTWGDVDTDVDEEGNPYIIQMGFIDTIAINKQSFHVEFSYFVKDGEGKKWIKDEQTVACGEAAVEPSHEDMYLPFAGWFLNGKIDEENRWLNVTEDMYFQADYVYPPDPVYYTVTFVDKDGNTIGKPEEVLEFENAHPPIESIPKFDGWHFIRWEGSYINITSDRTIRAVYGQDAVYWTVNYYNWDDEWLGKEEVQDGLAAQSDDIYPYKTGHLFIGWDAPLNEVRKDMKVTAVFDAAETPTYKVTVIAENGSVKVMPKGVDLDHVTELTVLQFEPVPDEDYEFRGFDGYNAERGLTVTEPCTVIAHFARTKAITYTVTFLDWNGDYLFSEIVEEGKDAKGTEITPTREGYTFIGWSKPLTNITGDLIVIALYEQNPPTGVENTEYRIQNTDKILRDGHLYILVNDRIYDATGRLVK